MSLYTNKLEKIVGKRYKTLLELKADIEAITKQAVGEINESQSEKIADNDLMIDYCFECDQCEVFTIFYLKDMAGNYYITEV